jgi:hypothetical protein
MDVRTPWFHASASLKRRYFAYLNHQHPHDDPNYRLGLAALIGGGLLAVLAIIMLVSDKPSLLYLSVLIGLFIVSKGFQAVYQHRKSRTHLDEIRSVVRRGLPVTGYVLWAHDDLYKEYKEGGAMQLPCRVLFTTDPALESDPEYMRHLVHKVFTLSDTLPDDREMRQIARLTTDFHYVHYRRQRIPLALTDGAPVYGADIWVDRGYLPEGYLLGDTLPCFAEPGPVGGIELVPYWLLTGPTAIAPPRNRPQERRLG